MTAGVLLEVVGLSKEFGGLRAVDGVDFAIPSGGILGLLGPNGAGKTVCFNMISGVYRPSKGEIYFGGRRIDRLPSHDIAALGLGRTFQIVKPFSSLTVRENVMVALGLARYRSLGGMWRPWNTARRRREAEELLERVGLADLRGRPAALLPLGNLRRLEIARALAVGRRLILLDESFSGLRHEETLQLVGLVEKISRDGVAVLLIEHNMQVAMGLCERIVVLDHGRKIAEGTPGEISRNERVIEAYLGRRGRVHAA